VTGYDVLIVGGGPAGCILANRLSADPSVRVLVLEAGGPDRWWDLRIQLPLAMGFPVGHRTFDWRYESEPEPGLGMRRLHHPRGKVLGGSSSINGMLYERGHRASYDRWAAEATNERSRKQWQDLADRFREMGEEFFGVPMPTPTATQSESRSPQ